MAAADVEHATPVPIGQHGPNRGFLLREQVTAGRAREPPRVRIGGGFDIGGFFYEGVHRNLIRSDKPCDRGRARRRRRAAPPRAGMRESRARRAPPDPPIPCSTRAPTWFGSVSRAPLRARVASPRAACRRTD